MSQKTITVGTVETRASIDANFGNSQDNFSELYANVTAREYIIVADNNSDITTAIQAAIDLYSVVAILKPGTYVISDTITIQSNRKLILANGVVLKLANGTSKVMFENSDTVSGNVNIELCGGKYDGNNANQTRNDAGGYIGTLLRFNNIIGFKLSDITITNPVSFGIQLGNIRNFVVTHITFDYTSLLANMDGLHLNGLCSNGDIKFLSGNTNDDLLALNADDGTQYQMTQGDISNITVDHIYCSAGYRGVRILSGSSSVNNIVIRNISGRFTYAGVLFSNYGQGVGNIYNITLENIDCNTGATEGVIHIDSNVKSLNVSGMNRTPTMATEYECVRVSPGKTVDLLIMENITVNDLTTNGVTLLSIYGTIGSLNISNVTNRRGSTNNARLLNLDGGTITNLNVSNCNMGYLVELIRAVNGALIKNVNITNATLKYCARVFDIRANITNINITNTNLESVTSAIFLITTLTAVLTIRTSNLFLTTVSANISKQPEHQVRLISYDLPLDPTTLTPSTYDMVINNNAAKGVVGPAMFNGTTWISLIDGTTIS